MLKRQAKLVDLMNEIKGLQWALNEQLMESIARVESESVLVRETVAAVKNNLHEIHEILLKKK